MATERLLTYAQAAARMGIKEPAFRRRVERGSIPADVLVERPRGSGQRPEKFVLVSAFESWVLGTKEPE